MSDNNSYRRNLDQRFKAVETLLEEKSNEFNTLTALREQLSTQLIDLNAKKTLLRELIAQESNESTKDSKMLEKVVVEEIIDTSHSIQSTSVKRVKKKKK